MTTDHDPRFDELRAELASVQERVLALAADNADLRARLATPVTVPSVPGGGATAANPPQPADRRTFLRGGALAAGVLAAGAAASVAGATPAAAANGDNLVLGQLNNATLPTGIAVNTVGFPGPGAPIGFGVAEGEPEADLIAPAAIFGHAGGAAEGLRVGVQGMTDGEEAAGVYGVGLEHQSVGVWGNGNEAGVFAIGQKTGITAESETGIGLDVRGGTAALRLRSRAVSPPFDTEPHTAGEMIAADAGPFGAELWFCVESGTPGTWRQLAGPATAGSLVLLASTFRIYDSRPGNPPLTGDKTKLTGANSPRTVTGSFVEIKASAILVNLTVVNTSAGGGFVALHKGGTPWPGNSSINWTAAGTVIANAATVALDADRNFEITCAAGASTDIIIDLVGVYT